MGCCCSKRPDPASEKGQTQASTKSLRSEIDYKIIAPERSNRKLNTKWSPKISKRHSRNWSSSPSSPKSPSQLKTLELVSEIEYKIVAPETSNKRFKMSKRHSRNISSSPSSPKSPSQLKTLKRASTKPSRAKSPRDLFNEDFSHKFLKTSIKENYSVIRKLNSGIYAETFLANDRRTGVKKVIREVKKSSIPIKAQEKYILEIQKFQCLDHPNIVKLHEVYETEEIWSLVYEFLPGSNLLYKIRNESIGTSMACSIIRDILSGLSYCHRNRIIHLGLNLEKIILDTNDGKINCKIIGFSYPWEIEDQINLKEVTCYMSPEVLSGFYNNFASDIWSAGVILYLMIQGKPPFKGISSRELLDGYKLGINFENNYWVFISSELKDLLRKMLEFGYNNRISIKDALNHPWVKNNQSLLSTPANNGAITRLVEFTSKDKIAKAIFTFFKVNLTNHNESRQFIEIFKSLDTNKDGQITKEELLNETKNLDIEVKKDLEKILENIDLMQKGYIEFSEFSTACTDWNTDENLKKFEKAFKLCDKSGDGLLSVEELKESIKGINNKEWAEFLASVNTDQSGTITFEELKKFLFGGNCTTANRI